jgi:hypothetical protein
MITAFLRGGLGNQMFQYALAASLAKKNGVGLALDTVFLGDRFPRPNFTYRTFDLDVFQMDLPLTRLSRVARAMPVPGLWLGLDLAGITARRIAGIEKFVSENSDAFDPAVPALKGKNILLFGSWQCERYFADHAEEVRAAFRLKHPFQGEALSLRERILGSNAVSLHVRRTDYATPKYAGYYGATDLGYYERAIAHVAARVSDPVFFVFSDDIGWCKENLTIPFPAVYLDRASEGPKASHHLGLMSLCKHHVIANSSFSWWGAWLNPRADKIVVAPSRWFADPHKGNDVVPAGWVRL